MFSRLYPIKNRASVALVSSALLLSGCASTEHRAASSIDVVPTKATSPVDPYESFNRSMYTFNMGLDEYLLKPVSDGYKFITPDAVETGVSHFFSNLKGINVVLNDLLQGKVAQAGADSGRFLTNTTIGLAGLIDVAAELGLQNNIEDFGQTLAVWGVEDSTYLVLPILGPTTIRDGSAGIMDRAANPGSYAPFIGILEGINDRANAEGALNFINEAALDPYIFTRESFLQYRHHLINDGKNSEGYDLALEDSADLNAGKTITTEPLAD